MRYADTARGLTCLVILTLAVAATQAIEPDKVGTLRVPEGGIQPQVIVDGKGVVHMIYFRGDPAVCTPPLSRAAAAVAVGSAATPIRRWRCPRRP